MKNWKSCALMLLPLALALSGCGPKLAGLQPSLLPVMPALPPSARQDKTPPNCSPTCLQMWSQKAEQWQRLLTAPESRD